MTLEKQDRIVVCLSCDSGVIVFPETQLLSVKILERQDREIELETARFFLREMKNKNRQPLVPNESSSGTSD